MNILVKILLMFFLLLLAFSGISQDIPENSNSEQYIIQYQLPKLEILLDSAVLSSPLLKIIDADIVIQNLKVKSERKNWLSYINVNGSAKYGRFDNLVIKEDLGLQDVGISNSEQTRYSFGLSVSVPFETVFDKSNIHIAREEKEKLVHERDKIVQELRKLVIVQYGNLLRAHKRLVVLTSQFESGKMLLYETELNYKNGLAQLADYSKQKNEVLNTEMSLEESKVEFSTALYLLQETVGIKIKLNSEN
jgi:outer membrane protein TolC